MKKKTILELALVFVIAVMVCVIFAKERSGTGERKQKTTEAQEKTSQSASASSDTEPSSEESSWAETGDSEIETSGPSESSETTAQEIPETEIPGRMFEDAGVVTDSDAFCVIDESGNIIVGKNEGDAFAPASITKVLTALVVLEHADLQDRVIVREEAILSVDTLSSGVYPSMKEGEVFTVEELLYALILPSTNAAGTVLANYVAGSEEAFADLMNRKLQELGLSHSHFVNAHGLDAPGHYVSAYDMCVILKAACENSVLRKILGTVTYTIPATDFTPAREIVMGHRMVTGEDYLEGVFAGKPGGSINAGSSLVTAVTRNGRTLYVCTLHATSGKQYQDTRNLIEKSYALLSGGSYVASGIIYDLTLDRVNGTDITASFSVGNDPVTAVARVFDLSLGDSSAQYVEMPLSGSGRIAVSFTLPNYGSYELQVYLSDSLGNMNVVADRLLCMGTTVGLGMFEWNGSTYYGKQNGFIYYGAAEVPGGFYYAADNGMLMKGFVGGRFYAGEDYSIVTGWFTDSYETYYAGADGRIVTGKALIGGELFEFTDYGALKK